jgi:hypothetical protein
MYVLREEKRRRETERGEKKKAILNFNSAQGLPTDDAGRIFLFLKIFILYIFMYIKYFLFRQFTKKFP